MGLTRDNPLQDPVAVLHHNNRLYISLFVLESAEKCQHVCQMALNCNFFSWDGSEGKNGKCYLFKDKKQQKTEFNELLVNGPKYCVKKILWHDTY